MGIHDYVNLKSFLERELWIWVIWGYIFGGATIFGLIVGIFSVYNGRRTRKEICNLIKSEGESFKQLFKEISLQITKISEQTAKILDQGNKMIEQLIRLGTQTSEEHRAMIDVLAKLKT